MRKIIVAIDGFSSCGKSTLAKDISRKIHYRYVDSGAMYRAVTLFFLEHQVDFRDLDEVNAALLDIHIEFIVNPETLLSEICINGKNVEARIRKMDVSEWVSEVSAIKEVRYAMVALQKKMGRKKGLIMDGRDIGTTVFPQAELKIFLTADVDIRGQRRFQELIAKGEEIDLEKVKENLAHRDYLDSTRKESPLIQASDARVLDNTYLSRDEQVDIVLFWIQEKMIALAREHQV